MTDPYRTPDPSAAIEVVVSALTATLEGEGVTLLPATPGQPRMCMTRRSSEPYSLRLMIIESLADLVEERMTKNQERR